MNILFLEDEDNALEVIDYLKQDKEHVVYHSYTLASLQFFLKLEPGIRFFDAIIVDVSLPGEDIVSIADLPACSYHDSSDLNGCLYLLDNLLFLKEYRKKIALRTAYIPVINKWFERRQQKVKSFIKSEIISMDHLLKFSKDEKKIVLDDDKDIAFWSDLVTHYLKKRKAKKADYPLEINNRINKMLEMIQISMEEQSFIFQMPKIDKTKAQKTSLKQLMDFLEECKSLNT